MILWTLAEYETVFPQPSLQLRIHRLPHGFLELERRDAGWTIRSLQSTDPADYLNPCFLPGNEFDIKEGTDFLSQKGQLNRFIPSFQGTQSGFQKRRSE